MRKVVTLFLIQDAKLVHLRIIIQLVHTKMINEKVPARNKARGN